MPPPEFINLSPDNLEDHHLCCALGDKKHLEGVALKKAWLRARFEEGLVFRKLDVRGKVFIEYTPAEVAWRPIVAPGWMAVHCLWVSGRYKKQGYGRALVAHCVEDTRQRGMAGVVIVAAKKKRPFLSDRKFLLHLGFEVVDEAGAFLLLARQLVPEAPRPRFSDEVHSHRSGDGFEVRCTHQCPFNHHWAPQVVAQLESMGHEASLRQVNTVQEAQKMCSPLGAYGLRRGGALICHHLTTPGATTRLLDKLTQPEAR